MRLRVNSRVEWVISTTYMHTLWPIPGEMIMNCSWTFMNCSWMFVSKKLWTFRSVHLSVHELFMNIIEPQMRLSWKFMSYILYMNTLFMNLGCSWTAMNSDNSWTFTNVHLKCSRTIHECSWTTKWDIHEIQVVNNSSQFMKLYMSLMNFHEVAMNRIKTCPSS